MRHQITIKLKGEILMTKRGEWISENGKCKDCGGSVDYNNALNKITCDTCENEEPEWM